MKKIYLTLLLNTLLALSLRAFANDSLQHNAQQLTENPQLLKKILKDLRINAPTPLLGANNGIVNANIEQITSVALTNTKIVVAYRNNAAASIVLQAGEINGQNITFGGITTVTEGRNDPALVRLSDSEFALAYAQNPEEGFIRRGTVTGTSISLEASTMFTSGADDQENIFRLRMLPLTANRLMVLYSTIDLGGNFDVFSRIIDIDDSPATVGDVFKVNNGIDLEIDEFDAITRSSTEVLVAYRDIVSGKIARLSIADFNISFATASVQFQTGAFLTEIKLVLLNTNQLAVFYADTSFGNAIRARLGNINPTSIGLSPAQTIANINTYNLSVTRLSDTQVTLAYVDANILGGQVQRGYLRVLDALSDSFDIGAEVQYSNPDTEGVSIVALSASEFVVSYEDGTNQLANARIGLTAPYTVGNLNDSGTGSLRAAIQNANSATDPVTIDFDLAAGGTINLSTNLPIITNQVTIDGSSAGNLITLNGVNISVSSTGLHIQASNCIIRGLEIINFDNGVIFDDGSSDSEITNSTIGGCGNGINIFVGASGIQVRANLIGTNSTGTTANFNSNGIIADGSSHLIEDNLISGNTTGIYINFANLNTIKNNFIGTNVNGDIAIPNEVGIVLEESNSNTIETNLISGNDGIGIRLIGANGNSIRQNDFGVGQDENVPIANGIAISIETGSTNNTIRNGNIIANSLSNGIQISGSGSFDNEISDNSIYCNTQQGIAFINGGNNDKQPPVISTVEALLIAGTCTTCTTGEIIEIYSDNGLACNPTNTNPQARVFLGSTTVAAGAWSFVPTNALIEGVSITATATTSSGNTSTFATDVIFEVCEVVADPPSLDISALSDAGFTITWEAVPDVIGYRLTVSEDANFQTIVNGFENTFITNNSQILANLNSNTQYFFFLQAESTCGVSQGLSGNQFTLASAPIALPATGVLGTRFRANWQPVEGIEEYVLVVARDITFNDIVLIEQPIFDNSFLVEGLTSSTTYYYRVLAVNQAGNSQASNRITVTTSAATLAPGNLTANPISATQIQLNWTDNSTLETAYLLERRLGLTGMFTQIASLPANTVSYNDEGLSIGQEYCYRVRAEVLATGFSAYSNIACSQTADVPETPSNLTATASSFNQINLVWEYSGERAQGFRIERASAFSNGNFIEIASVGAEQRSFEDIQVNANVTYTYRIRAFSANGNSPYSNRATATTPIDPSVGIPVPPFDLQAVSVSPQQIDLVWEYITDPNVIYKIERSVGNPANFEPLSDFVSLEFISTKRFSDTLGLEENTVYFYRILACTAGGESAYSNIVSAVAVCNLQVVVIRDDSGSEIICGGKTASMTISNRIFGASYQWRRNGQDIPGAVFANYFASETGQYSCEVSVGFGGACSAVSINELLVVVLGSPDALSLDFEGDRLQASVRDADRYEWFLNYELIPNATEDTYIPTQPGIYFVVAIIGNCASTSNLYFFGVTANDDQNFAASFQLSPNPATDRLHFQLGHQINAPIKLSLLNAQGKQVMCSEGIKEDFLFETHLDLATLPRGLYILEVELGKLRGQKKVILY